MNQLVTAATIGLCCTLAACSGSADPVGPKAAPGAAATSTPSTSTTSTGATSTTPTPAATTTTGAAPTATTPSATTPSAPVIDQSTPEGAMTAWLGSMVSGNSKAVCALMASGGKPISAIKNAEQSCASTVAPTVEELSTVSSAFSGLSITGATTKGSTATFGSATTTPALAAKVISGLKAVKIGAKWYVTP